MAGQQQPIAQSYPLYEAPLAKVINGGIMTNTADLGTIADMSKGFFPELNNISGITTGSSGLLSKFPAVADPNKAGGLFGIDWLNEGNINAATGAIGTLGNLWSAWNQMQMMEESLKQSQNQFDFSKDVTNRNLSNQAKSINAQLEDRQRARIGGTGDNNAAGNYESLSTYMDKNRVDGSPIK